MRGPWVYPWKNQEKSEKGILSPIFQTQLGITETQQTSSSLVRRIEASELGPQAGGDKGKATWGRHPGDQSRKTIMINITTATSINDSIPSPGWALC